MRRARRRGSRCKSGAPDRVLVVVVDVLAGVPPCPGCIQVSVYVHTGASLAGTKVGTKVGPDRRRNVCAVSSDVVAPIRVYASGQIAPQLVVLLLVATAGSSDITPPHRLSGVVDLGLDAVPRVAGAPVTTANRVALVCDCDVDLAHNHDLNRLQPSPSRDRQVVDSREALLLLGLRATGLLRLKNARVCAAAPPVARRKRRRWTRRGSWWARRRGRRRRRTGRRWRRSEQHVQRDVVVQHGAATTFFDAEMVHSVLRNGHRHAVETVDLPTQRRRRRAVCAGLTLFDPVDIGCGGHNVAASKLQRGLLVDVHHDRCVVVGVGAIGRQDDDVGWGRWGWTRALGRRVRGWRRPGNHAHNHVRKQIDPTLPIADAQVVLAYWAHCDFELAEGIERSAVGASKRPRGACGAFRDPVYLRTRRHGFKTSKLNFDCFVLVHGK